MKVRRKYLYLFPPIRNRFIAYESSLQGVNCPERYLLYGMDRIKENGNEVFHNLTSCSKMSSLLSRCFRQFICSIGGYSGDLEWFLPCRQNYKSCDAVFVFSDRALFPLLYLRMLNLIPRKPIVVITVGLPEKLAVFKNNSLRKLVIDRIKSINAIVSLSAVEAESLKKIYGIRNNLIFLPAGVDTNYFKPLKCSEYIDVLSIGADPFRDFDAILKVAAMLPKNSFQIVTTSALAQKLSDLPMNVQLKTDLPMTEIRPLLASCKVVALPVNDNTYSGGTTVMLQAMAMGKPVIANPIGANRNGYGFVSEENCIFCIPGEINQLASEIGFLLSRNDIRATIGRRAREHVENSLQMSDFHKNIEKLLISVCDGDKWA